MNQERREILRSIFSKNNIFTASKAIALAAVIMTGIIITLFWSLALYNQTSERKIFIKNNNITNYSSTNNYLCSVKGKRLCSKKELFDENIYMAKLTIKNYFYFSYYPQPRFINFPVVAVNLLIIIKIFSKLQKRKKILL